MPNKRDPNKAFMGIYVDRKTKEYFKKVLADNGTTITEFFYAKMLEIIERKTDDIIQKLQEADGRTVKGRAKNRARG